MVKTLKVFHSHLQQKCEFYSRWERCRQGSIACSNYEISKSWSKVEAVNAAVDLSERGFWR